MHLFLERLKAQSAIEYLMTYGWMLLVVAVVGGAIFSMVGDQSIEAVQGFNSNEVSVNEFGMTPSSLQMSIGAFGANNIRLKEARLHDGSETVNISINEGVSPGDNKVLNLPHFKSAENSDGVEIELIYDADNLENLSTRGTVTGGLELDNSLIGYWELLEKHGNDTHVKDLSRSNNMVELKGPEWTDNGRLMFNDAEDPDYIHMGNGSDQNDFAFSINDDFTLLTRFKVDDIGNSTESQRGRVVGRGRYSCTYGMYITQFDGSGEGQLRSLIRGCDEADYRDHSINSDEWINAATRWTGDNSWTHTLYINGESVTTKQVPELEGETLSNNEGEERAFGAGGRHLAGGSTTPDFQGEIEYVMLYDQALSPRKIKTLQNNPGLIK